jgi:anaerobic selenocysteine-containing dehydrogenase
VIERPEGMITQRARVHDGIRPDTIHPDGYWWEPSVAPGPELSAVWVANANAITPSDPALSSYAGDQPLRGARCRIRRADKAPALA